MCWLLSQTCASTVDIRMTYQNEKQITRMSEQHQNPIKKFIERGKIDIPNIIYMSAHNPDLVPVLHNKKWRD